MEFVTHFNLDSLYIISQEDIIVSHFTLGGLEPGERRSFFTDMVSAEFERTYVAFVFTELGRPRIRTLQNLTA